MQNQSAAPSQKVIDVTKKKSSKNNAMVAVVAGAAAPLEAISPGPIARVVHHAGVVVPTLRLTTEQSLSESGIALLLQMLLRLHSRLQDTRVRKIY
jgi:hypothetical protein